MLESVDLPMVDALNAEWLQHPPTHYLVAAYLGHKPPAPPAPASGTPAQAITDIDDLVPELGNVPVRKAAPIDTAAFDAAMQELSNGRQR